MPEPTILFEDDYIVVVNKPAGMIVYPDGKPAQPDGSGRTGGHDYPALSHWLETRYKEYYFVHRIDRETSGVLLIAKTEKDFEFLKEQFKEREVRKVYRAFVQGVIKDERGVIDKPIGTARGGVGPRSAQKPHGELRDALTAYRVIERGSNVTYVEVFPKTGRTHQIRVHFSAVQHPIVCDRLYAPRRGTALGFKRLALHALSLTITHPNQREMTFEAPLPTDFLKAEGELRKV